MPRPEAVTVTRPTTIAISAVVAALLATALGTPQSATAATAAPAGARPPKPPSDARLAAEPARHDLTREQSYFLLPDRFANGSTANDRGGLTGDRTTTGFDPTDKGFYQGGDLRGLIKKLDYVKGLGTTAIWMAPIFKNKPVQGGGESAGYHGYWITDFTQVDPHFGTNAELAELIDKAHARGMKVFFDVITNHTADTVTNTEKKYAYRPKGAYPYLDTEGRPFDDSTGMGKVDRDSFPYTPVVPADEARTKVPAWLNDPSMYHNRGDSTFVGESGLYGDHTGLDDLWTERPEVVKGLEKIYQRWVEDFDVDGFRVDTVRNVDMPFWTQWATAIDAYAAKKGREDFFVFGETLSSDPAVTAPYVTRGRLDATLDFPLQNAIRGYASQGKPATTLSGVLAQDYRYTTDKANAYEQVTFLGNHDMGRIGSFVSQDNPGADDAELLRRDRFAHELLFLSRGNPVVYAGDEQGFTGPGGDKGARQTLFASRVQDYLDDDQIGTERTHASDAYDPAHPLYRSVAALSRLTKRHPALRDGVQQERYADEGAGVYAFSRTDLRRRVEYVVAVNNAERVRSVRVPTYAAGMGFRGVYGSSARVTSGRDGKVPVVVPPLSAVVLKAARPLGLPVAGPSVSVRAPAAGATGDVEVAASVDAGPLSRVVFAAQVGDGPWRTLGSADHAPYKVTQHLPDTVRAGTVLRYKAVVVDSAGRTASATATTTAGQPPAKPRPSAVDRPYAVVHYQRTDGDYDGWRLESSAGTADFTGRDAYGAFAWVPLDDSTGTVTYTVEKDGTADGPQRAFEPVRTGEVWIEQGEDGQAETAPEGAYPPQDQRKAVLHYHRADGDYDGWGLHTWTGAATPTDWTKPLQPVGRDTFGVTFEVPLADGATSLSYIVHRGDEKDITGDRSLDFAGHGKEVWLIGGTDGYLLPTVGSAPDLDLGTSKAQWIDADTVVWKVKATDATSQQLVYAPRGGITIEEGALSHEGHWLRLLPATLSDAQKAQFPHLKDHPAFTVDPRDRDRVRTALRGQVIATQRAANGALLAATGVQVPGVLDDLYGKARDARLGAVFERGRPTRAHRLHPAQATGADPVVKDASYTRSTGSLELPGRSVAVFTR
ncbi:putative acarbose-resistent alpha-amylase [Streptomyces glaucescens]|uniref:Alpha-amylase GacZ2 n=1 Tax=Streptomyces glaucescens TaxID=1907 RepID=B3CJE7_STRGA|nr:putative acarbose-resistent alpha-amylase [Streptomyces glaucescens]CAQ57888.1 alpha-amylase GacZ2 [Streptomyces glaucescens]